MNNSVHSLWFVVIRPNHWAMSIGTVFRTIFLTPTGLTSEVRTAWIGKGSNLALEYYDSRRLPHVFGAYGFLNLSYQRWVAAIPAYSNHCTLRYCHTGTHLFLNRTNIAVTLYCLLSNSETSSTGGIRFHNGAYRNRTCTAFLQDDLARRSATITAMHHAPC